VTSTVVNECNEFVMGLANAEDGLVKEVGKNQKREKSTSKDIYI